MRASLFLNSPLLEAAGVRHGFSLRAGGVSQGAFASLNLSRAVGDAPEAVEENLRRIALGAGLSDSRSLATAKQVHRDRVLLARHGLEFDQLFAASEPDVAAVSGEQSSGANPATRASAEPEADAIVSRTPGIAAAVRVADCTPILLWAPDVKAACAVHSGWRGARLQISGRGVRALASGGAVPANVIAAIGPCIGRCCYAVSAELAATFRALFGPEVADDPDSVASSADRSPRKDPHLDLRACAEIALLRAGVRKEQIDQVPGCTSCSPDLFFSHRRDRGTTGRHLAFIAP